MSASSASLVVTADDRTGAVEAAALCADAGWWAEVVPFGGSADTPRLNLANCVVVDLGSRHLPPEEAQRRITATSAAAVGESGAAIHRVHKIDSTLRGNWAEELTALIETGRRIVLIPAHPPAGRVAIAGVVLLEGVPVADTAHGRDPRLPVFSSRPADRLPGVELAGVAALTAWLSGCEQVAIVDASTIAEIEQLLAVVLSTPGVVIAGSASVVGAVARASSPPTMPRGLPDPLLPRPLIAVGASLHPMARAQLAALADVGVDVVASPVERGDDPEAIATEVAERAHHHVAAIGARSVILIGGDTAGAFIGPSTVEVFGSVDATVGIGEAVIRGRRLRLATKPGGFGTADTLVDLVRGQR